MLRRLVFAVCIVVAAALVAVGVAMISLPVGVIVAGLLLAVVSWLLLADTAGEPSATAEADPLEAPAYPVPTVVDDAA